jgi:DNA-binding NarL/FixJ family response regulator
VPGRVLIADHHEQVRRLVRSFLLDEFGLRTCAEAVDGFEAIKKAQLLKPDLIVLEVSIPGLNGLEAAPEFRKLLPKTLIILFTRYGDLLRGFDVREIGVDAVVSKEEGMSALGRSLDILLRRHNFRCTRTSRFI